jgi:hypothetical protein
VRISLKKLTIVIGLINGLAYQEETRPLLVLFTVMSMTTHAFRSHELVLTSLPKTPSWRSELTLHTCH